MRHVKVFLSSRKFFSTKTKKELKLCYNILDVDENSDYNTVHKAYLRLVKIYHPDSKSPESNAEKFQELDEAYRKICKKISEDKQSEYVEQQKIFDIKHTAPQHRQYLSYEGAGIGTPMQREKQWIKARASKAAQNVMEHRINKAAATEHALMDKNKPKNKHDIKTQYGFDRLVEDLIQEAMSKGEFDNLRGTGKPLSSHQNTNPYVDFVTHKMNQVLIDNGFTPEWITLQKEIREQIDFLRSSLLAERSKLGPLPLTLSDEQKWLNIIEKHVESTKKINSKITHYNLVVPILKNQMIFISLPKEADKILKTEICIAIPDDKDDEKSKNSVESDFFELLFSLFKNQKR